MGRRRGGLGRWRGLVAVLLLAAPLACTADESDTGRDAQRSAAIAAAEFLTAWSDGNYAGMAVALDGETSIRWSATRLERWMTSTLERGGIDSIQASLSAEPRVSDGGTGASAPFAIAYYPNLAPPTPPVFGSLAMDYDDEAQRWLVAWGSSLLWPGIEGAARFEIVRRWPARAPIVDRKGRPLASGPAANRSYPYGSLAGSTIGHLATAFRRNVPDGYQAGDLFGASGMEGAFETRLAGRPASRLVVADTAGKTLKVLAKVPARRGQRVKTTLDIDVQRGAQEAYGSTTGGAVVLDPRKGDLLAVVDSGAFDPGNYVGSAGIRPFNRALEGLYPPGSAMKVVTASAALDSGTVTPSTSVTGPKEYQGVRNFESGQFGAIDFATALKFSVNTAFAQVAEKLGSRRITRYAEAFGFNRRPALPLAAAESSFPIPDDLGDLMWGSIGQAQVVATPMEMATVAATIANGGRRMEPRITLDEKPSGKRAVSRATARTMTQLMENVVIGGTGSRARISGLRVAGKTGTAEVDVGGRRRNHAWFIAFAPVEAPRVAVAVVSEYGGVGGQVAAPLAGQILVRVLPLVQ